MPTVVTIYGADLGATSFGALGSTLPTGQSLTRQKVNGWGFPAGQAAWFSAFANGTLLIADQPQFDDPTRPTARTMGVTAFKPNDASPATSSFRTIVLPTSGGTTGPKTSEVAINGGAPAGADVEDLQVLANGEVAYLSASPYNGWDIGTDGVYPTYGTVKLNPATNEWGPGTIARTGLDLKNGNPFIGAQACPQVDTFVGSFSNCLGPAEMALLPSGNLVVSQYFPPAGQSAQLLVLGQDGVVHSLLAIPPIRDPEPHAASCASDPYLRIRPREVEADPTSAAGDDRFTVIYDVWHCGSTSFAADSPFIIQELSYNASTFAIAPRSNPIAPGRDATGDPLSSERAHYDAAGNLWIATMLSPRFDDTARSLNGAGLVVFAKTGSTRRLATACPFTAWSSWGAICTPDFPTYNAFGQSQQPALSEAAQLGQPAHLVEDPANNLVVLTTLQGNVLPVVRGGTGAGLTFSPRPILDLGLAALATNKPPAPAGSPYPYAYAVSKGAVDPAKHELYVPVQGIWNPPSGGTAPTTPLVLPQYVYRVDLAKVLSPPVPVLASSGTGTTRVQAEDFTGQTGSYSVFRTNDANAGTFDVGLAATSTLSFTLSVPTAGSFRLQYRVANGNPASAPAVIELRNSSGTLLRSVTVAGTGNWLSYATTPSSAIVNLPSGTRTYRVSLTSSSASANLNWFSLQRV